MAAERWRRAHQGAVKKNGTSKAAKAHSATPGAPFPAAPSKEDSCGLGSRGSCGARRSVSRTSRRPLSERIDPDSAGPPLEPDYCAAMDVFVAEQGLKDHVRFMGYAEVPWDFYKAADVMVFASREEGFGTVVIEAMAYGLPVVARRLPGVNDIFVDQGTTGYLFERDEEYVAHLGALLRDGTRRRDMGAAGRAFVAAHYDIARVAASYMKVYGFPDRPK